MAGLTLRANVNVGPLRAALRQTLAQGRDLRPVLSVLGRLMQASVRANFSQGGRPEKWTPLAPSTLKHRRGRGRKPLVETGGGHLPRSITFAVGSLHVDVGSSAVDARLHQLGGRAGRKHGAQIPARPFLVVQPEDETQIRHALERFLLRPLGGR
jgi:phage virion morphogenesis protein